MNLINTLLHPIHIIQHYTRQMAPLFWGVSIMPFYIGWSLASKRILPAYSGLVLFITSVIAIGPFLGGATILLNDYWDERYDTGNRRKVKLPLLRGLLKSRSIYYVSLFFFFIAAMMALFISPWFLLFILSCIILSFLYSAPPFRLKEKPGLDFLTNAIGAGVICTLAGWTLIKPINEFPVLWGIISFFGVGAIYMPTTIIDYEPDISENVTTIAVRFGKKNAYYMGMACITIATSLVILMCILDYILDMKLLPVAIPIAIGQIVSYWFFLKKLDFKGGYFAILVLTIFLFIGNGLLLFYNAGMLSLP